MLHCRPYRHFPSGEMVNAHLLYYNKEIPFTPVQLTEQYNKIFVSAPAIVQESYGSLHELILESVDGIIYLYFRIMQTTAQVYFRSTLNLISAVILSNKF